MEPTRIVVYKYPLTFGTNRIRFKGATDFRNLHVHEQHGKITLWVELTLDPYNRKDCEQTYIVVGTGMPFDSHTDDGHSLYVGTSHLPDGTVWHVYEQFEE